jgi:hypothetical protein
VCIKAHAHKQRKNNSTNNIKQLTQTNTQANKQKSTNRSIFLSLFVSLILPTNIIVETRQNNNIDITGNSGITGNQISTNQGTQGDVFLLPHSFSRHETLSRV